jgi:hypothetical protein
MRNGLIAGIILCMMHMTMAVAAFSFLLLRVCVMFNACNCMVWFTDGLVCMCVSVCVWVGGWVGGCSNAGIHAGLDPVE